MRADDAIELEDVVFDRACAARRLARKDIEAGADAALADGARERRLVYDFGARRVDDVRAGRKRGEHVFINEIARIVFEPVVDAQNVAGGGYVTRRRLHLDAEFFSVLGRKRAAPGDDRHTKSTGARNHLLSDAAKPDQPQRAPEQAARFAVFFLIPLAFAQVNGVGGDATVEREDQAESEFSDGDGVLAGAVGNIDAARRRRLHINRVVARACTHDQAQAARFERRARYFGAAHDQHVRAR